MRKFEIEVLMSAKFAVKYFFAIETENVDFLQIHWKFFFVHCLDWIYVETGNSRLEYSMGSN